MIDKIDLQNETLDLRSISSDDPGVNLYNNTYPAFDSEMFIIEILTGMTKMQDKTLFSFIRLFDAKVRNF